MFSVSEAPGAAEEEGGMTGAGPCKPEGARTEVAGGALPPDDVGQAKGRGAAVPTPSVERDETPPFRWTEPRRKL